MEKLNVNALFLGPKSENRQFFTEMLNFMVNDHIDWRKYFHPDDKPVVAEEEHQRIDFQATLQKTREVLIELAGSLQLSSVPWFSPRYLGHMNTDILMAANLGYMLTLLYNPNNCAYEGSPATTTMEIEVGRQLAALLGYDPEQAWGHVTSGGTVANYEGLWIARNLKSIPHAVRKVKPELVMNLTDWELLNLPTGKILDLIDQVKQEGLFEVVRKESIRGAGLSDKFSGKLLVPQSKHYSWVKAADIFGIGQENLVFIQVKDNYRMDIDALRQEIDKLTEQKIPILGVVGVVGTTEEGAIDEIHEIVKLRSFYQSRGVSFYLHIDAAYGGYARAVFLDEQNVFMDFDHLKDRLHSDEIVHRDINWPQREVYEAFQAIPEADSITIDPHKMGYIPYAAGAVVFKDRRVLDLVSYFAAYVFEKNENNPLLLGSYIMEGSKAGASAAAVWTAHKVVPLNVTGYGRIIGSSIEGANRFYRSLLEAQPLVIRGKEFNVRPLTKPDFNMVDFTFYETGNLSLNAMNMLNQAIYEQCSYKSGPLYINEFITSKTDLNHAEYGDAPKSFVTKLGIPAAEWNQVRSLYVLRSCVVTPYLAKNTTYEEYWGNFINTMWKTLQKIL